MKKKLSVLLLVTAVTCSVTAQERPKPALFMMNYAFLNPALNGIEDYAQVQGGFRRQWLGTDGAPATNWLTASVPFRKKGSSFLDSAYGFERPSITDNGHGLGISFYQDNIGPYSNTNLNIGYAYHLPLSADVSMSGGISAGLNRYHYDAYKNIYIDPGTDPSAVSQSSAINSNKYSPELNMGVMLYGKSFFAGVSAMQLIRSKFVETTTSSAYTKTQVYFSGGYMAALNETGMRLWLSTLVVTDFTSPIRVDVNSKIDFNNMFWVGASYRENINMGISAGLPVARSLVAGYLYEWNMDGVYSAYGRGSHELSLGYKFLKPKQRNVAKMGW